MTQNDIQVRDAISTSAEYLAENLAYFSIIEKDCRYQGNQNSPHLENALVAAYKAILEYSAEVRKRNSESKAGKD
jgi:hypothetical protein